MLGERHDLWIFFADLKGHLPLLLEMLNSAIKVCSTRQGTKEIQALLHEKVILSQFTCLNQMPLRVKFVN